MDTNVLDVEYYFRWSYIKKRDTNVLGTAMVIIFSLAFKAGSMITNLSNQFIVLTLMSRQKKKTLMCT